MEQAMPVQRTGLRGAARRRQPTPDVTHPGEPAPAARKLTKFHAGGGYPASVQRVNRLMPKMRNPCGL
jgi:hypothetical protein